MKRKIAISLAIVTGIGFWLWWMLTVTGEIPAEAPAAEDRIAVPSRPVAETPIFDRSYQLPPGESLPSAGTSRHTVRGYFAAATAKQLTVKTLNDTVRLKLRDDTLVVCFPKYMKTQAGQTIEVNQAFITVEDLNSDETLKPGVNEYVVDKPDFDKLADDSTQMIVLADEDERNLETARKVWIIGCRQP